MSPARSIACSLVVALAACGSDGARVVGAAPAAAATPVPATAAKRTTAAAAPAVAEVTGPRTRPIPRFSGVDEAITAARDRAIELRRKIHQNPELGEREHQTAALVAEELRTLGLEVRTGIAKTGVVGILKGGKPGKVVAWRADMDALPITEETGLPFASTKRDTWGGEEVGVMHACGHDVHTAVGLGLARVLADEKVRAQVPGTVVFVFQPAEEGMFEPGSHGAKLMVEEGVLRDPAPGAIFGLHTDPKLEVGKIAPIPEGALAASDRFEITIEGKGSHGAYPQESIDPIVVAAHTVVALQTIASRTVDTRDTVVVTVGQIEAGNRYNIIPETAELVGTIRTHRDDIQSKVHERLKELAEGTAKAHGARADVRIIENVPVTVNDRALLAQMRPVLVETFGDEAVVESRPHMGAEDFAWYARETPGLYVFVGVANEAKKINAMSHTSKFMVDEGAIEVGMKMAAALVLTWLADSAG